MLGLTKEEWRRMRQACIMIWLSITGLTVLTDTIGKRDVITTVAAFIMAIGFITTGIMYITTKARPVAYVSVLMITLCAGVGASTGVLITSLY